MVDMDAGERVADEGWAEDHVRPERPDGVPQAAEQVCVGQELRHGMRPVEPLQALVPGVDDGSARSRLAIAALGSFFAGTVATVMVATVAIPLSELALKFGPAEVFCLVLMGMFTIIYVGGKDVTKSLMSMAIGLGLGTVGTDIVEGQPRFTYGISELLDGIEIEVMTGPNKNLLVIHTRPFAFLLSEL